MKSAKPYTGVDLKNFRISRGLSQMQFAGEYNVPLSTFKLWELRGEQLLPLNGQTLMAKIMGTHSTQSAAPTMGKVALRHADAVADIKAKLEVNYRKYAAEAGQPYEVWAIANLRDLLSRPQKQLNALAIQARRELLRDLGGDPDAIPAPMSDDEWLENFEKKIENRD